MNFNLIIFKKINSLVGRSIWLDAFGRAGAEWGIVGMLGWFGASAFIKNSGSTLHALVPILYLSLLWLFAWGIDLAISLLVREPRPRLAHPTAKILFWPLMGWKSFPSDHAMSAALIFFTALIFILPGAWALLVLVLWVAWGRVYAGAHYPLDIAGGVAVAGFVSVLGWYIAKVCFLI